MERECVCLRYIERERKSDSKRETESVKREIDIVRETNRKRVNNTHTRIHRERCKDREM